MRTDAPHARYYRSMQGRWRSVFSFALTDRAAFWATPMPWLDRLRVLSLAAMPRWLGPLRIETSVDIAELEQGRVLHTTRVSWWGLPLMRSAEVIALDDNGRDATMRGAMAVVPVPWPTRDFGVGRVTVNEGADGAFYSFDWFGTRMEQRTEVIPEGLLLVQQTPWSMGEQRLVRLS